MEDTKRKMHMKRDDSPDPEQRSGALFADSGGTGAAKTGDSFLNTPEADTGDIVDFMHEEIKKRPMNRRRLLQQARQTLVIAIVFGVVSCLVFAILLPVINNILYPGEDTSQTVALPEAKPSEELSPEEMVESEREREATEERAWIREELEGILDEKIIGVDEQKRISAALQELAAQKSSMLVTVYGITEDTDWFNDAYENRNTTTGLVTKKAASEIFILTQGLRIADAQRVLVTFHDGTEASAQIAASDTSTGLTMLTVPIGSIPAGNRASIEEAQIGSSRAEVITGAPVIAIGSPTGLPGSVVYGNVTGADGSLEILDNNLCRLSTDIYGSEEATGFLIDLDGAVVGMIDMRYRDSNIPNMVCAVGITELNTIIRRLEKGGAKAFLGISGIDVTREISETNDIPVGVWVTRAQDDGPAMAAGIQKGDIIVGCDGTNIQSFAGLIAKLENTDPGNTIHLHIMRRKGGSFEEIRVPVATQ